MAFIRDFIKSSINACFGDEFTPALKRWGGFFNFLEVYLLVVCIKYQKKFWFTEIGLVHLEKNVSQIWKTWFENRHTDIAHFAILIHTTKLIHCVAIFTILYGNYYSPYGEFKLMCIGKFARRTWVNFTQQYGKNRQRCQQYKFYYYCYIMYIIIENFPKKFSPCTWVLFWGQNELNF